MNLKRTKLMNTFIGLITALGFDKLQLCKLYLLRQSLNPVNAHSRTWQDVVNRAIFVNVRD